VLVIKPVELQTIVAVLQVLGLVLVLSVLQVEAPPSNSNDPVVLVVVAQEDLVVVLAAVDAEGNVIYWRYTIQGKTRDLGV
jgi:hypothetical protein